jgi:hypothetical protein
MLEARVVKCWGLLEARVVRAGVGSVFSLSRIKTYSLGVSVSRCLGARYYTIRQAMRYQDDTQYYDDRQLAYAYYNGSNTIGRHRGN